MLLINSPQPAPRSKTLAFASTYLEKKSEHRIFHTLSRYSSLPLKRSSYSLLSVCSCVSIILYLFVRRKDHVSWALLPTAESVVSCNHDNVMVICPTPLHISSKANAGDSAYQVAHNTWAGEGDAVIAHVELPVRSITE